MRELLRGWAPVSRRQFLERTAKAAFGVSIIPTASGIAAPMKTAGAVGGKAKRVIYLFMNGAMTHLDTFDLKPGREEQGETKPIATNVAGMKFGNNLPELAKHADKLSVVRSMYTETGAHEPGRYLMRTSYKEIATIRHPSMGAWAHKLEGKRNKDLPDTVIINGEARHPMAGFLDPEFQPLPIGDPDEGLKNTESPEYLTDKSFGRRMELIGLFDKSFQKQFPQKPVQAYNDFYDQATRLLASDELKVFDLKEEKDETRDRYGRGKFGQGVLLARRLAESNVRFIEVDLGGWDHHVGIYENLPDRAGDMDKAFAALLEDLKSKGMLDETLVVLATEFGRTPKINQNAGRDHHPGVFSCVLAGGGIGGGRFYGSSDEQGHSPWDDPVTVGDFNATIATAMGLPLKQEVKSREGRPFKVAHDGTPLLELFS